MFEFWSAPVVTPNSVRPTWSVAVKPELSGTLVNEPGVPLSDR